MFLVFYDASDYASRQHCTILVGTITLKTENILSASNGGYSRLHGHLGGGLLGLALRHFNVLIMVVTPVKVQSYLLAE